MFLDANDLPGGARLESDICIGGAGAAGISMALELAESGRDVVLLESGGFGEEPDSQALYRGAVADERLHSPLDRYRQRRFGGSTTIWGGRCVPFDDIDFAERDWIAHSGWPIARSDLVPYYERANELCEAGPFAYTEAEAFTRPLRPMIAGFSGRHFATHTLERFSCPTDFAARYGARLRAARNVRVVLHANVTLVRLDAAGRRVEALDVRTLAGRHLTVAARHVVLAAGGLEVARLLLASRDVHSHGIGNRHDVVGRHYMCHLAGTIGDFRATGPRGAVWHGYDVSDEGVYCRRRLALAPASQRAERIGNFVARLHHPRITNPEHGSAILSLLYLAKPLIAYEYRKRLHDDTPVTAGAWLKHVGNLLSGPFDAAAFAAHMVRDRMLAERKFPSVIITPKVNLFSIDFHAEQEPNPASRVTLGTELDALGVPRLAVDWRYTAGDLRTVARALALLADDVERSGVGRFSHDPDSVEVEVTRYGAYGGHHLGTARMGRDPRTSVVDGDCRVHDVENLHVASSAVFPTSSQANPTLTVIALALRLAGRLQALTGSAP
jgi:choline dehydrogenase-like flavoprotein